MIVMIEQYHVKKEAPDAINGFRVTLGLILAVIVIANERQFHGGYFWLFEYEIFSA
jgi:hypothetical protein